MTRDAVRWCRRAAVFHKNDQADQHRSQCGEQDRRGGDVFGSADEGMVIGMDGIGQELNGRVHSLGYPDRHDGNDHQSPFPALECKPNARGNDGNRGHEMNAGMRLGCEQIARTSQGASEAADTPIKIGHSRGRSPLFRVGHKIIVTSCISASIANSAPKS